MYNLAKVAHQRFFPTLTRNVSWIHHLYIYHVGSPSKARIFIHNVQFT